MSHKNVGIVTALLLLSHSTFAQSSCGFFDAKVKLADNSSLCVKEVSFFNRKGLVNNEPNSSYASKAQQISSFAIAGSSDPKFCPLATYMAWNWGYQRDASEALTGCNERLQNVIKTHGKFDQKVDCKCEVLVDSSITSKFTKQTLTERTELFSKQIASGNKPLNLVMDDGKKTEYFLADDKKQNEELIKENKNEKKIDINKIMVAGETNLNEQQRLVLETQEKEKARISQETKLRENEKLLADQKINEQKRLVLETQEKEKARISQETKLRENERVAELNRIKYLEAIAESAKFKDLELAKLKEELASINLRKNNSLTVSSNRKALVIGNDNYSSVTKLVNARQDANSVGISLTEMGYKVIVKNDLNEKEMKATLRQFKNDLDGGDEVVFFYAGHGVQIGSTNYLLPTDIKGESEDQVRDDAIQLQRVLDDLNEKKVKLTLAIIDACRDNPFPKAGRNMGTRGLAPTTAATGQMIIFSAGAGQQALDKLGPNDKNPNGLFTRMLLNEMKNPTLRVDNMIREVRRKVVEAARLVGHDQVPSIYDQVVGDFYLNK